MKAVDWMGAGMRRALVLAVLTLTLLLAVPVALSALRGGLPPQPSVPETEAGPARPSGELPAPSPAPSDVAKAAAPGAAHAELEWGAAWERIDLRSLETLGEPLELGDPMYTAASPDGRFLASVAHRVTAEGRFLGRRMVLADARQWTIIAETPIDSGITGRRYGVVAGPHLLAVTDAGTVVWVSGYRTVVWDTEQGDPKTGPSLPSGFIAWDIALLGGSRVGLFGPQHAAQEPCSACPARVVVLDLQGAAGPLIDVALPDIGLDWVHSDQGGQQIRPGLAWDAERERAYVVEGDTVTAVDLSTGEVASASIRTATLPERLLDWAAPAALAKTQPSVSYSADLSPDGARLYVTGVRTEPIYDIEGVVSGEQQVPLGLRVIDTVSLRPVGGLDLPVSDIRVAPDGRVLLTGVSDGNLVSTPAHKASGLYVLSPDLHVEHHIADGTMVWVYDFPDVGLAVVSSDGRLQVVDLDSGEVVAERKGHGGSLPEGYLAGGFVGEQGRQRPAAGSHQFRN